MNEIMLKNKGYILVLAVSLCLIIPSCETGGNTTGGGFFSDGDREKAIKLIGDANLSLKRIKVLYRNNKSKVDDLKKAIKNKKDIKKVKELADDLSLIILDGYALAETAQENIEEAQDLKINDDWKEYSLKAESLEMQIKAFDFRNASAKLLRDKFGGENKVEMQKAADTFKKNEEEFFKNLDKAKKLSNDADKLMRRVNRKKRS